MQVSRGKETVSFYSNLTTEDTEIMSESQQVTLLCGPWL